MREDILAALAGLPVVGAFIYGSVARGTATAASDVDVFVIVEIEQTPTRAAALRTTFGDLQRRHGYWPDPDYPVELFTVDEVGAAIEADAPDEDQREVLRALRDAKDVLVDSEQLQEFITTAGNIR